MFSGLKILAELNDLFYSPKVCEGDPRGPAREDSAT